MTTATPLEDALVGALRILDDLARRHLTADDARRDLAALGRRHDLRLRLISDEEPFDGSVHYDVLVRGTGQPTVSLSLAAGPGLPWPLRGMSRSSEFDLVEVDGEKTTVAQAVACLDAVFDDVRLMRTVVDSGGRCSRAAIHPIRGDLGAAARGSGALAESLIRPGGSGCRVRRQPDQLVALRRSCRCALQKGCWSARRVQAAGAAPSVEGAR
jgi:hypothetical protein